MNKFVEARAAFFRVLGYELTDAWKANLEQSEKEWSAKSVQDRLEHLVKEAMIRPIEQEEPSNV